uniref:Podocalyxin n=1 Tax=Propithecus coquereli TaxID=379532 RepID=A0A2K6ELI6_PROCO
MYKLTFLPLTPSSVSPSQASTTTTKAMVLSKQVATSGPTKAMVTSAIVQQGTVQPSSDGGRATSSLVTNSTLTVSTSSAGTLPKQTSSTVATDTNSGSLTTTAVGSTGSGNTTLVSPIVSAKPEATSHQDGTQSTAVPGDQSGHGVSTGTAFQPMDLVTATHTTPLLSPAMPTKTSESSSKGQHHPTTASSSLGTTAAPGLTVTPHGMPTTVKLLQQEKTVLFSQGYTRLFSSPVFPMTAPTVILQGTHQTSSQRPAVSTDSSSKVVPQHTSLAPGTATTPPVGKPPSSISELPTTVPQGPSTPSPSSASPVCSPLQPDSSPLHDKLVTLLCRAAKATFSPAHDKCRVLLAPVPEIDAVAVKEITIQTNLPPEDIYEQLKDKWDDLKEVGVSHMQLGDQGPPEEAEDRFSTPLIITIVCMASFLLLVAALYGCCHQRLSQRKDQQRLTEELQTVENGYHDNPTLEVMETSSEMQEKKVNLNGELGDSWIVPLDNLTKDDLEEEDTHL